MKITFLQRESDRRSDESRAVAAHAASLAEKHDVEIVSLVRGEDQPDEVVGVRQRHVGAPAADAHRNNVDTPIAHSEDATELPSALVPRRWDPSFDALCDRALESVLPTLDSGIVVTTTPGLLAAVAGRLAPGATLVHLDLAELDAEAQDFEVLQTFTPHAHAVLCPTAAKADWLRRCVDARVSVHFVPIPVALAGRPASRLNQPLVIANGAVQQSKRRGDMVEAFASVASDFPNWRLRILGAGGDVMVTRAVRRLALFDRVELLGLTPDPAIEWAKASVALLTSQQEPALLSVQESLASGVPMIAYDCPTGPGEFIQHGHSGIVVRRGDVGAVGRALRRLMDQDGERRRMGAAARAAAERFSSTAVAVEWEAILASIAEGGRPAVSLAPTLSARDAARVENEVPPPAVTPAQSRADLVAAVATALAGVAGWFVLPARGEFPPTFVIPEGEQPRAVSAIADADLPRSVSAAVDEQDHWLVRRSDVASFADSMASVPMGGFRLEPWPTVADAVTHLAEGSGIRVEFWARDHEGCLVAFRQNPYLDRVHESDIDAEGEVEGCRVPEVSGLRRPFIEQCTFPIDVVYTWVDDGDPEWQRRRESAVAGASAQLRRPEAAGAARFRNRDELRYSLRSINAYAPWVRNIFIVTAGQRPSWLTSHPRVTVVDHRQILPDDALPTFPSHAIETGLHKIPGLSEHYIYFNDDVFLARPLGPERFFTAGGNFAAFLSERTLGVGQDERPFVRAGLNNRRLLEQRFGVVNTHAVAHTPHPLRRSVLVELCHEFADSVERTARSPFRSPDDVSVTASLAQHYGVLTGAAYLSHLELAYVDTSKTIVEGRLRSLLRRDRDAFCLGDHHDYALRREEIDAILSDFFEQYFPVRSPWEDPSS